MACSEIINKLMNESAWKQIFGEGDYFTNANTTITLWLQVVGGRARYSKWRTKEENKKLKGKNNAIQIELQNSN